MRKTLIIIESVSFLIAVVALFFVLFLVGDTDVIAEPPPWTTAAITAAGCLGALVGGVLHWVGLPIKPQPESKKKSATSAKAETKSPSK